MKFFQKWKLRRAEKKQKKEDSVFRLTEEQSTEARDAYLENLCSLLAEAETHNLEIRKEYEVVTAYLADIQRIDMLPKSEQGKLKDCARVLLNLDAERRKTQRIPAKITVAQRNAMEPYEKTMPEEIRKLEDYERYQQIINSDLRQLEAEKAALEYEREDALDRSSLEQKLLIAVGAFCGSVALLLLVLQETLKKQVQLPFLFVIAAGILAAGSLFLLRHRHIYELRVAEKKMNRVIFLLNKVKIKYVNCTGVLEYSYEKFHVSNGKELHYNWQEYLRLKEEERKVRKTGELLDFYQSELVRLLKEHGVQDAGIWVYQCEAILEEKEMVEVRHRLNVRRQKLRQQIDYNNGQADKAKKAAQEFAKRYPEYEESVGRLLGSERREF